MDEAMTTSGDETLDQELEQPAGELEAARRGERAAVDRLKAALLAAEPALEPSMVTGETAEEVEASFAAATALLSKLRERAAAESVARVPAGAPGRHAPRPRTAFEKIRDGLGRAS